MSGTTLNCGCSFTTQETDPCLIVIFGASGDLAARKLVPSLYRLYSQGSLSDNFVIVGASRTPMSDAEFCSHIEQNLPSQSAEEKKSWTDFAGHLRYLQLEYDSPESFLNLAASLTSLDLEFQTGGNRIFYLATPPSLYGQIATQLGEAGLAQGNKGASWARIVVEKPFGHDTQSAVALDRTIKRSFTEEQVFRIDHYLAKETVQNILMLRFANTIFEPIWNRSYIQYVGIITAEGLGVEHRAGYYEQAGVIRDMFQNHMMQLLALTAMEPPSLLETNRVRDEKMKVFGALKSLDEDTLGEHIILGQYGAGTIAGQAVPAYRDEEGVDPKSCTPTFAMMRLFVDTWRWKGVPFYLASGKRLKGKMTKIVVQFKEVPHSLFHGALEASIPANRLVIGVYPEEKITLRFEAKGQGPSLCLAPVNMEFTYPKNKEFSFDSYEKVLLDCIQGDHMLFWHQQGIEQSWAFLEPVLQLSDCAKYTSSLHPYPAGSWGPDNARKWMSLLVDCSV